MKDNRIYMRLKVGAKWKSIKTDYSPDQREQAVATLRKVVRGIKAEATVGGGGPVTVSDYGKRGIERRREQGDKTDVENDLGRLRKHVFPHIGPKPVRDVLPADIRDIVARAKAAGLAPRTVRNIYSNVSTMFRDAAVDGLIAPGDNPCILTRTHLPKLRDKNPRWRGTAVYTREEIAALLFDERVPLDRRTYYAVLYFTGARLGEVSGLRVQDFDRTRTPLGSLSFSRSYERDWTKTGVERVAPVHPVLAHFLTRWIDDGWRAMLGRDPQPGDVLVPTPELGRRYTICRDGHRRGARHTPGGRVRNKKYVRTWQMRDMQALEFRHRRIHDFRRSMISHATSDGADRDKIETISHRGAKDVLDLYITTEWESLCRELSKLQVSARTLGLATFATTQLTTTDLTGGGAAATPSEEPATP